MDLEKLKNDIKIFSESNPTIMIDLLCSEAPLNDSMIELLLRDIDSANILLRNGSIVWNLRSYKCLQKLDSNLFATFDLLELKIEDDLMEYFLKEAISNNTPKGIWYLCCSNYYVWKEEMIIKYYDYIDVEGFWHMKKEYSDNLIKYLFTIKADIDIIHIFLDNNIYMNSKTKLLSDNMKSIIIEYFDNYFDSKENLEYLSNKEFWLYSYYYELKFNKDIPDNISIAHNELNKHEKRNYLGDFFELIRDERWLDYAFNEDDHSGSNYSNISPNTFSYSESNISKLSTEDDWFYFSNNQNFNWTIDFIEKYKNKLEFGWRCNVSLSNMDFTEDGDEFYHRSGAFYKNHNDYILADDDYVWDVDDKRIYHIKGLSCNPSLPWGDELLNKFANYFDWYQLSYSYFLPWSKEFISKYFNYFNIDILSSNKHIKWDLDMLAAFEDKVNWEEISKNEGVKWSSELIYRFIDKIDFKFLCINKGVQWDSNLIDEFADKIDWVGLSTNSSINWTEFTIDKYKDRLAFEHLLKNNNINWTEELILKYSTYISINHLINSEKTVWTENLLAKYSPYLNYNKIRYANTNFEWTVDIVDKYYDMFKPTIPPGFYFYDRIVKNGDLKNYYSENIWTGGFKDIMMDKEFLRTIINSITQRTTL